MTRSTTPVTTPESSPERLNAACEWCRALCSLDLLLDLIICLFIGYGPLVLPQHERPPPVEKVQLPQAGDLGAEVYLRARVFDNAVVADSVTSLALLFVNLSIPIVVAVLLSVAAPVRGAAKAWVHSYVWTMAFSEFLVGCGKRYCGYWRPHFLHECEFNATIGACTFDDHQMFRSFPSAHASSSMAALLHTSYRLLGACRVASIPRRLQLGRSPAASVDLSGLLTSLCLLPMSLAWWIALSRVSDNAHHPADVVGGVLIGGGSATLWYLRYFHAPFSDLSHRPRVEHSPGFKVADGDVREPRAV